MRSFFKLLFFVFLTIFSFSSFAYDTKDLKDGDLIFRRTPSRLEDMITGATHSKYSHVGIIIFQGNTPTVLEAVGPVKYTILSDWIRRAEGGNYTVMRLKNPNPRGIEHALQYARTYLGRPYDIQYEMDDGKIYCSELVYKAFLGGMGVELGKKQKLRELDWKPFEKEIRVLAKGELPLDRIMVTPESVAQDEDLKLVFSNF